MLSVGACPPEHLAPIGGDQWEFAHDVALRPPAMRKEHTPDPTARFCKGWQYGNYPRCLSYACLSGSASDPRHVTPAADSVASALMSPERSASPLSTGSAAD